MTAQAMQQTKNDLTSYKAENEQMKYEIDSLQESYDQLNQ